MAIRRSVDTDEKKQYWEFVDRTAQKVEQWPEWLRGGSQTISEPTDDQKRVDSKPHQKALPNNK